jgi:phospholipase C
VGFLTLAACSSADDVESNAPDAAIASDGATNTDGALPPPPPPPLDAGAPEDAGADAQTEAGPTCPSPPLVDPLQSKRDACTFIAGARVKDSLGVTPADRAAIPIEHVIIVTQENRSFDHYYGKLSASGQPDAEGWPAGFTNPDKSGAPIAPMHLSSPCLPLDPPHQGAAMTAGYAGGAMSGFVKSAAVSGSDGHFAMGYYDATDLPFYYFLANTFSIADRYFGAALGGTWANRDYLYAGTSDGIHDTGERTLTKPTIFDALDKASIGWTVYTDGNPRQDCLGWNGSHAGLATTNDLLHALKLGHLLPVSFVDPTGVQDEHPTNNVNGGERFFRTIYDAAIASPLWMKLAIIFTYDESGGLFDHVPPPKACIASPDQSAFDRRGIRVPTIVISPWARQHYVSHVVHDHTSALRLIELLNDLPALTARDANADALLDMFDFNCPSLTTPPAAPQSGSAVCK